MGLYCAFVQVSQSAGISRGQSWYKAIEAMRRVLTSSGLDSNGPSMKFLSKLFNTHKSVVAKRSVLSTHRDEILSGNQGNKDNDLDTAYSELEKAVALIDLKYREITSDSPVSICSPHAVHKTQPDFYEWLGYTATDAVETDPRQFANSYRKYVMRQKHK